MKFSKILAMTALAFFTLSSTGCLNGPVAEFSGSFLPNGISGGYNTSN